MRTGEVTKVTSCASVARECGVGRCGDSKCNWMCQEETCSRWKWQSIDQFEAPATNKITANTITEAAQLCILFGFLISSVNKTEKRRCVQPARQPNFFNFIFNNIWKKFIFDFYNIGSWDCAWIRMLIKWRFSIEIFVLSAHHRSPLICASSWFLWRWEISVYCVLVVIGEWAVYMKCYSS